MTIDIAALIRAQQMPSQKEIEKSLGKKHAALLTDDNYKALAKLLEKNSNKDVNFGIGKVYPVMLAYALAGLNGDKNSYNAIIRIAKKQIHGYDVYDARLTDIIEACEEMNTALKAKSNKTSNVAHTAVQQDLGNLFDKLNSFEDRILAERLDAAYEIYQHCKAYLGENFAGSLSPAEIKEIIAARESAAAFLRMLLNLNNDADIDLLMAARDRIKLYRPEYIPRKYAVKLTNLPNRATNQARKHWIKLCELARAHRPTKFLNMRPEKFKTDIEHATIKLTPLERDSHRLIIKDGTFYQRQHDNSFEKFDTMGRRSHGKEEYIAYTINPEREISVFDHYEIADRYAHSSMNAQGKVMVSGELRIEDGELTHLTVYSMHYRPQEENVYEALKFFKEEGVDLAKVTVRLWDENSDSEHKEFIDVNAEKFYEFHANIELEDSQIEVLLHPEEGYKEYIHPTQGSVYEMLPPETNVSSTGMFSQNLFPKKRSILQEQPELIAKAKITPEK